MTRTHTILLFVAAQLACVVGPGTAGAVLAQDVGEARRLRVLFVMDTDADNISGGVRADRANLIKVFQEVRRGREDKIILEEKTGDNVTPDQVLGYCQRMKRDHGHALKDESLLVIYSGHGGIDPVRGHFLAMRRGRLYRSDLRDALDATGARLTVILTNCCSNIEGVDPPMRRVPAEWAAFKQLFFQHCGMVDITAAEEGTFAWINNRDGGFFTLCLTRLLCEPIGTLDKDGNGFVDWTEFSVRLTDDTEGLFVKARDAVPPKPGDREHISNYGSQRPLAYTCGFAWVDLAHWHIASRGRMHQDQAIRYGKHAQKSIDTAGTLTCAKSAKIVVAIQDAQQSYRSSQLWYERAAKTARDVGADSSDVQLFAQQASQQRKLADAWKSSATRVVDLLEVELRRQQQIDRLIGDINALRRRISSRR